MTLGKTAVDGVLSRDEIRQVVAQAAAGLSLMGKRVLTIIPDGTRTMPMPLMFQLLQEEIGTQAAACDYLVALGTHSLMNETQLSRLMGCPVVNGACGNARVFNHRWDFPDTFVDLVESRPLKSPKRPEDSCLNRSWSRSIACSSTMTRS